VLSHRRSQERAGGVRRVRLRPLQPLAPLARETSAGGCRRGGAGPRPRSPLRAALPVLGAGRATSGEASASPLEATLGGYGADGLRLFRARPMPESEASGARERTLAHAFACGAGIGRSAVVLVDRVGCRSRRAALGPGRKAMGLARWLPCSRRRAQQAKARRKPGRGGESRQHASSDTGGGLLVIPHAHAQASSALGGGSTRRWKASWSGAGRRL